MAISNPDKQDVISRLLVINQKAHILATSLRFKGQDEEAEKVTQKAKELSEQIDHLLGQVMDEWLGQAESIRQEIQKANASLQASIRQIGNEVNILQNVVRAIGFIDDVIQIASRIAAAL